MIRGWAFMNYGIENDGWNQFCGIKRASAGYIGQEIEQLVTQAKEAWAKERRK